MKSVQNVVDRVTYTTYRRLDRLLVLAFALTIASFLISRGIWESRTRGVDAAASSITSDAAPAVEHLSAARAELRHMQGLLASMTSGFGEKETTSQMESSFQAARDDFEREWNLYLKLPAYAGEQELWNAITEDMRPMNDSIERTLGMVVSGDLKGAALELNVRGRPSLERVDAGLHRAVDINATNSARLGARITELRSSGRVLGNVLDALSAIFAAIAALLVVHLARQFARVAQLRMSELEHFAGRVAHDIRSPLMSVGLALDVAKRSPDVKGPARSAIDRGSRTLQRVGQLVDGLLVFARAGASPEHGEQTNVQQVLDGVVEEMLPVAQEKQIELRVQESRPTVIACSPGVLTSLVSNLVGNALKYMGDAPVRKVDVRVRQVGHSVRVEVQDTGPGIPRELREKIFLPYVRGAESSVPGMGLGLATVRRLAEAHGGAVGVGNIESGSLFWFEIPGAPAEPTQVGDASPVAVVPPTLTTATQRPARREP
jgi:signal transduction histidine kinase